MTSSFVKGMFSLISKVSVCFFSGSRECAYSNSHTVSQERTQVGVLGVNPHWAWYFTKTLLPAQRRL